MMYGNFNNGMANDHLQRRQQGFPGHPFYADGSFCPANIPCLRPSRRAWRPAHRRSVDHTSSAIGYIQACMWQCDWRDSTVPQPTPAMSIDILPLVAYPNCPASSFATKFFHSSTNKVRFSINKVVQGSTVACTAWHRPSVDADDMEARSENIIDESVSGHRKEPWVIRLMNGFSKSEKLWKVPWTSLTIFQVMFLWFCTFWLVGSWIIPLAAHYVGCSKDTLTYRGQALYSLITDIAEGTVGLGILHRCLAQFQPLPRNWFPFSWRGQWYIDVLLGCLTFPVVNRLSQLNLELLPFPSPLTSSYAQSIMSRDPIASVLYAIVVSVCCPIWEEVIFRGFLLPSLTRYLPMWASIFVSAILFGLAHFSVQRMLPLTFLGLVMGIVFVRSQNLLSSMLLHSLWNGFVFMGLLR